MENLLPGIKVDRVSNAAAAGTSDVNSDGVAKDNVEGMVFIAAIGAIDPTGTVDLKLQQSDDDGATDAYSDLEGSNVGQLADTDDNKLLVAEVKRPQKRYVRAVVVRGTANSVVDGIVCLSYGARKQPASQPADVGASEVSASPAEGTA